MIKVEEAKEMKEKILLMMEKIMQVAPTMTSTMVHMLIWEPKFRVIQRRAKNR
jgi:hypothetical protein